MWFRRIATGLMAAAIVLLVGPGITSALGAVVPATASWWWPALALLPALAIMCSLASGRWRAFLGITHFVRYPPLWVSALVGVSVLGAALGWLSGIAATFDIDSVAQQLIRRHFLAALLCQGALVFVAASLSVALSRRRQSPPPQLTSQGDLPTPEHLLAWIQDDAPICIPLNDIFGHARIAQRIGSRLTAMDGVKPPSMAIVGEVGSGKSSVLELVRYVTKPSWSVRIVPVGLWSYETPDAALQGIIRALVTAIAAEVSVPELHGLPREYLQLVAGGGGFWSNFPNVFGTPSDPRDVLKGVDKVAATLNLRYVLWVEDLERFTRGPGGSENVGPIRALFHLIDESHAVTLVLATEALKDGFDMPKLARYVESLPELPLDVTRIALDRIRQSCLSELREHGDIDSAPQRLRALLANNGEVSREDLREYEVPAAYKGGLLSALAGLCRTPRLLKFAVRRCVETWRALRGEVDFDDVLIMSVIREAEPAVFELVANHVGKLTAVGMALRQAAGDQPKFELAFELVEIKGPSRAAVRSLIQFVFPDSEQRRKPQGLCQSEPRDYWRRFLAEPSLDDRERDQPILKICWGDDDRAIVDLLDSNATMHAAEQFLYRLARQRDGGLNAHRLACMLELVISRRLAESGVDWSNREPPGLVPVCNLLRIRAGISDQSGQLDSILARGIVDSARQNVLMLEQLCAHLMSPSSSLALMEAGTVQRLNALVGTALLEQHDGRPAKLASALARSDVWSLRRLVDGQLEVSLDGLPWPTWPEFANRLFEAAHQHPELVLPVLAALGGVPRSALAIATRRRAE